MTSPVILSLILTSSLAMAETERTENPLSKLSMEEMDIYEYGEISTGMRIAGGAVGTVVGLGLGHLFIGKYTDRGWIFTVGEIATLGLAAGAAIGLTTSVFTLEGEKAGDYAFLYIASAVGFYGLRVWEIVDVWSTPAKHNRIWRGIDKKIESYEEDVPKTSGLSIGIGPVLTAHVPQPGLGFTLHF